MKYLNQTKLEEIVLLQSACFAVMHCFWNYPSTNLLTDICMYLGAILSLHILFKENYFYQEKVRIEIWLLIGLFIWVTIHLIFLKNNFELQLIEYTSIWKRSIIIFIFGIGFGFGLSMLSLNQNKKIFSLFYIGLLGPSIIYIIKFLVKLFANKWAISIPEYLVLYPARTSHFYMYKIDYTVACLPAFAVNLFIMAYGIKNGALTLKKFLMLTASSILILSIFYLENIKNAFVYMGILFLIFLIISLYMLVKKTYSSRLTIQNLKRVFIGIFFILTASFLFGLFFIKHIQKNDAWSSFLADAKIAVQVEKYDHWKYFGENGYPQNEIGNRVSNTNYERVAWGVIGLQLIYEHPLGYGLVERSFGHLSRLKWSDSRLDQTHSGILDLTLGIGIPGACIILAVYFLTFLRLLKKVFDRRISPLNKMWMSLLIWILFSFALLWLSSEISQKYYLIATLFWLSFGVGLLGKEVNQRH